MALCKTCGYSSWCDCPKPAEESLSKEARQYLYELSSTIGVMAAELTHLQQINTELEKELQHYKNIYEGVTLNDMGR